ncbi:hypothetical protein SAMN05660691_03828 [Rheinheimera pacifica]|uniref:Uncharacterized protein n=1 Tax=Rheinheimera pacifica TaxID=173990 RepID=A0A1H6NF24_9GAMM|nr:hypothetical protein [Rheinheimera pacifica]SEI11470.1 hypothetical protein SAMN05660691_03828 [Rheinheimera pacifica]
MEQDKKIFNWVLIIALFVFPVVGMIFLDAPEGVEGSDALFFSAAIGLGWGLFLAAIFAIFWVVKRYLGK